MTTKSKNTKTIKSRAEVLIKEAQTTKNSALKSALKQAAEEEKAKEAQDLLEKYNTAKMHLDTSVHELIATRKKEKLIKKRVEALDKALEQFKTDGDYNAFSDVLWKY